MEEGESRNMLSGIISRIKLESGQFTDKQSDILREAREYYKKLYSFVDDSLKDCDLHEYLPFLKIIKLSDEESISESLTRPITSEEAKKKKTLYRMKSDESPSSDGFTSKIFKSFFGKKMVILLFNHN